MQAEPVGEQLDRQHVLIIKISNKDEINTASAAWDHTCSSGTDSKLLRIILQSAAHRLSITLRSDSLVSMLENTDNIVG